MDKEEAIHIACQLLTRLYHSDNGDSESLIINANILTAEADENVDYLCGSLDNLIEFCNKLKMAMYNQL